MSFSFRKEAEAISNNGTSLAVNYPTGNRLGFGERTYQLETVTARTPSEHHIDGKSYPLELQLLHSQVFGDVAVISMLFDIGDANPLVQEIIDNAPSEIGKAEVTGALNARGYMTKDLGYYSYKGSMTTPPCAEPVDWFLMLEIGSVSQEQVDALQGMTGANNRPLQAAGGREFYVRFSLRAVTSALSSPSRVVIVGGGIIGCATAYYLTRARNSRRSNRRARSYRFRRKRILSRNSDAIFRFQRSWSARTFSGVLTVARRVGRGVAERNRHRLRI